MKIPSESASSAEIREAYTRDYYITDCGGHADFGFDDPLSISDPRLRIAAAFSDIRPGTRALDLGCGRGEITAFLAARGWTVDAIDYSAHAIELAEEHISRTSVPRELIQLHQQDFNSFLFGRDRYDLVIASDVIEHISPGELDQLYKRVSEALTSSGLFVVHTFPNAWFYNYEWPRRYRSAKDRGEDLPAEPRSHFEQIMHINEQSPRTLMHELRSRFAHADVWVGDPLDPFRTSALTRRYSDLRRSSDLFAVASNVELGDIASSDVFSSQPLSVQDRADVVLRLFESPLSVGEGYWAIPVSVHNSSGATLSSAGRAPVMLSYHWLDDSGNIVEFNGRRTPLGQPLRPGQSMTRRVRIDPAPPTGASVRLTLVQEGVAWFDGDRPGVYLDIRMADCV